MTGYYFDASALIKRYAAEAGTAEVVELLRALDAIHLASALLLREAGMELAFVCSDQRLKDAASREGLKVVDPVEHRD